MAVINYARAAEAVRPSRGVTRLDGARGQKQVWRPHVRTWGLSEANVLYWSKYLRHCWDFSAPPAVIWCPHSASAPGELCPPSLRLCRQGHTNRPFVGVRSWSTDCRLFRNKTIVASQRVLSHMLFDAEVTIIWY